MTKYFFWRALLNTYPTSDGGLATPSLRRQLVVERLGLLLGCLLGPTDHRLAAVHTAAHADYARSPGQRCSLWTWMRSALAQLDLALEPTGLASARTYAHADNVIEHIRAMPCDAAEQHADPRPTQRHSGRVSDVQLWRLARRPRGARDRRRGQDGAVARPRGRDERAPDVARPDTGRPDSSSHRPLSCCTRGRRPPWTRPTCHWPSKRSCAPRASCGS